MLIIGLDPGLAILGYGVLEYQGNHMKLIKYGTIETSSKMTMPDRLVSIYDRLSTLLKLYKPDAVAMEELFFNKNVKTALQIGHARGVTLLAAAQNVKNLYEYTPLQIKQAVVGYGRADKKQIQNMVRILLNLPEIPKPDDAADAVAVAICHANSSNMSQAFMIK